MGNDSSKSRQRTSATSEQPSSSSGRQPPNVPVVIRPVASESSSTPNPRTGAVLSFPQKRSRGCNPGASQHDREIALAKEAARHKAPAPAAHSWEAEALALRETVKELRASHEGLREELHAAIAAMQRSGRRRRRVKDAEAPDTGEHISRDPSPAGSGIRAPPDPSRRHRCRPADRAQWDQIQRRRNVDLRCRSFRLLLSGS